jgi:hypothetical protein
VVESKTEVTVRDQHKRKVQREELEKMARAVGGKVLEYRRDEPIEPLLQAVVEWKPPAPSILEKEPAHMPTTEMNNTACECELY